MEAIIPTQVRNTMRLEFRKRIALNDSAFYLASKSFAAAACPPSGRTPRAVLASGRLNSDSMRETT